MEIDFKEDKDRIVEELERFHDAVLTNNICKNKLLGFKEYIERIYDKFVVLGDSEQ